MEPTNRDCLARTIAQLGYEFKDQALLDLALTHSSYGHENPLPEPRSNERLEFLGDAVLELVVTHHLYCRHPEANEGQMSKARAFVVNETSLAAIAHDLGLGRFLSLGRGEEMQGGRLKSSILADALEALVAAVYLDGGLEAASRMVQRLLAAKLDGAFAQAPAKDFKTQLQEQVQETLHKPPQYQLVSSQGPDHDKMFEVALKINNRLIAVGQGRSKKEAEQQAARQGLITWKDHEKNA